MSLISKDIETCVVSHDGVDCYVKAALEQENGEKQHVLFLFSNADTEHWKYYWKWLCKWSDPYHHRDDLTVDTQVESAPPPLRRVFKVPVDKIVEALRKSKDWDRYCVASVVDYGSKYCSNFPPSRSGDDIFTEAAESAAAQIIEVPNPVQGSAQ